MFPFQETTYQNVSLTWNKISHSTLSGTRYYTLPLKEQYLSPPRNNVSHSPLPKTIYHILSFQKQYITLSSPRNNISLSPPRYNISLSPPRNLNICPPLGSSIWHSPLSMKQNITLSTSKEKGYHTLPLPKNKISCSPPPRKKDITLFPSQRTKYHTLHFPPKNKILMAVNKGYIGSLYPAIYYWCIMLNKHSHLMIYATPNYFAKYYSVWMTESMMVYANMYVWFYFNIYIFIYILFYFNNFKFCLQLF